MDSLQKYLKKLDAIFISTRANIVYLTGYNGFSEIERECFLLITKKKNYLITDRRYSEAIKKSVKGYSVIETGAHNFTKKNVSEFLKKNKIKKLGFEDNNLTVAEYNLLKKAAFLKPIDLSNIRIIKTKEEIKNIKLACKIGDQAFEFIMGKLKLGITEKQIEHELVNFIKNKNADISFKPIVAYGKNSSIPHHQTGRDKLKKNQIVLLDFGINLNNYCSDMTRTIFFGSASTEFKRMHQTVLEAQSKAIEFLNSTIINHKSTTGKQIDMVARDYTIEQGYPDIIHSVGHGIGIEVHESPHLSPNSRDKIQAGMIFSIEPGIYLPNYGGVRIEDLVLVGKNGIEVITHSNRGIIEI